MRVRDPNNVGRAVKKSCANGSSIVALRRPAISEQQKCWELLAQMFDRFQTLRNNSQQHVTGCANGRNM